MKLVRISGVTAAILYERYYTYYQIWFIVKHDEYISK